MLLADLDWAFYVPDYVAGKPEEHEVSYSIFCLLSMIKNLVFRTLASVSVVTCSLVAIFILICIAFDGIADVKTPFKGIKLSNLHVCT